MDALRIDRAVERLDEALEDQDNRRVDWAIRYTLNSKNARPYRAGAPRTTPTTPPASRVPWSTLTLQAGQWADGTVFGPKEAAKQLIDVTPKPRPIDPPPKPADTE